MIGIYNSYMLLLDPTRVAQWMIGFRFLAGAMNFLFATADCASLRPTSLICNGELRQEFEASQSPLTVPTNVFTTWCSSRGTNLSNLYCSSVLRLFSLPENQVCAQRDQVRVRGCSESKSDATLEEHNTRWLAAPLPTVENSHGAVQGSGRGLHWRG
jgi:hypothetical protein